MFTAPFLIIPLRTGKKRAELMSFKKPEKKFFAVWSTEIPSRSLAADGCKGSCMAVTAAFGMVLASRAVSLITGGGLKQS
jgi:tRNA A37 threonylcarbamoyladenosine dehydratase